MTEPELTVSPGKGRSSILSAARRKDCSSLCKVRIKSVAASISAPEQASRARFTADRRSPSDVARCCELVVSVIAEDWSLMVGTTARADWTTRLAGWKDKQPNQDNDASGVIRGRVTLRREMAHLKDVYTFHLNRILVLEKVDRKFCS